MENQWHLNIQSGDFEVKETSLERTISMSMASLGTHKHFPKGVECYKCLQSHIIGS